MNKHSNIEAVVSPANSFGLMDGGYDKDEYSHKVKWDAIYKYQYISGSFIHEHYDKLKFYIN